MAFRLPVDIANRALQLIGKNRIASLTTASDESSEVNDAYDELRLAELQRNLWKFATRRVILRAIGIDTLLWVPPVWVRGTTLAPSAYGVSAVVSFTPPAGPYSDQVSYWQLSVAETNSITSPDLDPLWKHYTGPLAVDLYNYQTTYQTGEIVLVPATWDVGTTYDTNQVVAFDNAGTWQWYVSLIDANTGNSPVTSTAEWVLFTGPLGRGRGSYGQTATGSPLPLIYPGTPAVYLSRYNNNADNPLDGTINWLSLGGTLTPLLITWPIGAGPISDTLSRNAFYLPSGFLKRAPNSPHANQPGYLGAASGVPPDDWTPEGPLMVSGDAGPITLRFVADVTDVPSMDAMFCEGLAARIGTELAFTLVDGQVALPVKVAAERSYRRVMAEARATNAIEIGPISPVENRYVTVRA